MKKTILYLFVFLLLVSCSGNDSTSNSPTPTTTGSFNGGPGDWLVPIKEIVAGGPGKDGIPSIENPIFVEINNTDADFLNDDDLIIGIVKGNVIRAYPHKILDWHEIVNDEIDGEFITISYCPLTGTAFGWESISNGLTSAFGVSGLLYNANLILYDRNTDSNWSQLKLQCINGTLMGDEPELVKVVETNWLTWKKLYPNTKVMTQDTGFSLNYDNYPYGTYRTENNFFIFPATPTNSALPNKERVYAIIDDGKSKVYRFKNFENGKVIKDSFNQKDYLIIGNENIIYSFQLNNDQTGLNFEYDFNNSEIFFKDNEGNKWTIFGEAIEGPRMGENLEGVKSVVSYWFAIASFYPNPEISLE